MDKLHNDPSFHPAKIKSILKEPRDKSLMYKETNDALYGERFVTNGESYVDKFLQMKSVSGDPSKVLILTDTVSKYNTHVSNDRVTIKSLKDAQGGEYDYVIIDIEFDESDVNYFESLRNFYTAISRSRMGSVIVKRNDKIPFGLSDNENNDAAIMLQDPNTAKGKTPNRKKISLLYFNNGNP